MKETIDKLDFTKMEHVCSAKCTVRELDDRSQPGRRHLQKTPLMSEMRRELLNTNRKTANTLFKKESQRP